MRWYLVDNYGKRYFHDYDMANLGMDTFYLNISLLTQDSSDIYMYTKKEDCFECPYKRGHGVIPGSSFNVYQYKTDLKFRLASGNTDYLPEHQTDNVICDLSTNFGQFGFYTMDVNDTDCDVTTLLEPVNIYLPILTVLLIYIALYFTIYGGYFIWKHWMGNKTVANENVPRKERVKSLDAFRGITIVVMIFVNYGSGGYEFIEHASWNGLHIADLVFPFFMWIMGACIPISLASSFKKEIPDRIIMINVLKRSVKLFLIGIFLASGSNLTYLRIFGVLQRFGIAYLVVTTICVFSMKRSAGQHREGKLKLFEDILKTLNGWIIVLIILSIHTIIIYCVAAPGCPKGYMGPGGLHKNLSYINCTGGATGYIDELILGNHRYQYPTIYAVYESRPFDPEGILGCLTTIFQVFIGVQAGVTLGVYKEHSNRVIRWLIWALVTGLIGGGLCQFSKEDGIIPVNKNLWSLSFVMVTSCFAFLLLSLCYILIDAKKWWSGKPFFFAGMNAMLMYIGHDLTDGHFPVRWYINNELGDPRKTHFLALFSDTWAAGMWVLVSYYLYKINYFFTV